VSHRSGTRDVIRWRVNHSPFLCEGVSCCTGATGREMNILIMMTANGRAYWRALIRSVRTLIFCCVKVVCTAFTAETYYGISLNIMHPHPQNWNVHIKGLFFCAREIQTCLYNKVLMVLREIISAHALTDPTEQAPPPEGGCNTPSVVFWFTVSDYGRIPGSWYIYM
jgi:hypothetical protein